MSSDTTCERRPPTCYDQKDKPITVDDEVKTWYAKTSDYWITKVLEIKGDAMTIQWIEDVGPSIPVKVPLGHVCAIGVDGGYGDVCSALGGASSSKTVVTMESM